MADSGTRRDSTSTRKPHRPSAANGTSFELSLDDVSIIRQGWLTKQGKRIKTWKKRWFVLNRDFLIYYKTPKETKPQGVIKLSEITEISEMKSKKNKFIFKAVTAYRPFPICADSEQTRAAWMESLQEAVDALRTPDATAEKPAESGSEAAEASTAADEKPGADEATSSTAAAEAPAAAADDGDGSGSDDYYDSGTMVFKKPTKKPEPVDDDGDDDNYDSGTMVFRPAEAAEADGSEEYDDGTMVRASGGDDDDYKPAFMRHIERKREEAAVRETNFDGLSEAELERMTAQITKQRDQEISVVTAKYETLRGVIMTVMAQKGVDSDG